MALTDKLSTWTASLSTLIANAIPSSVRQDLISKYNNVYYTLLPDLNLSSGVMYSGTGASVAARNALYPSSTPVAGNRYLNTTTGWVEFYDGSVWRPLGWSQAGQQSFTTATSSTELRFSLNSAASFKYSGMITLRIMVWIDSAPSAIGDTITLKSGTVVGTYGTTRTTRAMMSTAVGERIIEYSGSINTTDIYWQLTVSSGTIRASISGDTQLYYLLVGTGL